MTESGGNESNKSSGSSSGSSSGDSSAIPEIIAAKTEAGASAASTSNGVFESSLLTPNSLAESLSASLSKSSSYSSLVELVQKFNIPSHEHFQKFIHKHEVPRKVLHVSIGFFTLYLYTQGVELSQVTPYLVTALVVIGSIDFVRLQSEYINNLYIKSVGFLMREKEIKSINGVIWYLVGLVIVFLLFPKDISVIAVLLLSWADTAASTFGRAFGHLTPKVGSGKSLAGSIAAFLTGVISCIVFYQYYIPQYRQVNQPWQIMWTENTSALSFPILAISTGLIAAISEALSVYDVDDNLTIPVISACFLWVLIKVTTVKSYDYEVFAN